MYYFLVFAINVTNLEPVTLKNCMEYQKLSEVPIHATVDDLKKSGQKCEQSEGAMSFTCMKGTVVTKIVAMKNKEECSNFPAKTAKSMKTLMGK